MGVGVVFPIEKLMFVKVFEKKTKNQFFFWPVRLAFTGGSLHPLSLRGGAK
jgi:hypothetical protein